MVLSFSVAKMRKSLFPIRTAVHTENPRRQAPRRADVITTAALLKF